MHYAQPPCFYSFFSWFHFFILYDFFFFLLLFLLIKRHFPCYSDVFVQILTEIFCIHFYGLAAQSFADFLVYSAKFFHEICLKFQNQVIWCYHNHKIIFKSPCQLSAVFFHFELFSLISSYSLFIAVNPAQRKRLQFYIYTDRKKPPRRRRLETVGKRRFCRQPVLSGFIRARRGARAGS